MQVEYLKTPDNLYAFEIDGERLFETDEVAVLFDSKNGTLFKHGPPAVVTKEFEAMKAGLAGTDIGQGIINSLVILEGKFELEDINKIVCNTGFMAIYLKKLQACSNKEGKATSAVEDQELPSQDNGQARRHKPS